LVAIVCLAEDQPLRILISNDDGIHAHGLRVLAERLALEAENQVYVVAPDRERSATSHAITMHKPLRVQEVPMGEHIKGAWATNGTPSDCVMFALGAIMNPPPEVVISGINRGANLGNEIIYSGTVSAAMEGAIAGFTSMAVSLVVSKNYHFATAAEFIAQLVKILPASQLPQNCLLNINVPDLPPDQIKGIAVTEMGFRRYSQSWEKRTDPRGKLYYWYSGKVIETSTSEATDVWAVSNAKISITPVSFNMTEHDTLLKMRNWDELRVLFLGNKQ
jgi:5'-nucleotidase